MGVSFGTLTAQTAVQYCDILPGSSSGTTHETFSPTVMVAGKTTTGVGIPLHHNVITLPPSYSSQAAAINDCINYAANVWTSILATSDWSGALRINIHIQFDDLGWGGTSGTHYMGTTPAFVFGFGAADIPSVLYPQALANFLRDKNNHTVSGNLFGGDDMTITVNTNSNVHWFFGYAGAICPPDQVDFTTSLIHEICHGLGLASAAHQDGSTMRLNLYNSSGTTDSPTVYDYYVNDNYTGTLCASTGNRNIITMNWLEPENMWHYCTGHGHIHASDPGCTTTTDSLYFNSQSTYTPTPIMQLFVPPTWTQGSSISHEYEVVDYATGTATNTELMQPYLNPGNQFYPHSNVAALLSGLGWYISSTVGTGTTVTIKHAGTCTAAPQQVFTLGVTNDYCNDGTGVSTWTLQLFATDGVYTIISVSGAEFHPTLNSSDLGGHNWIRDINGNVSGAITAINGDNHGAISIGVVYAPQTITVNVANASDYSCQCDKETVSFYAPGAASYKVSKRAQFFTSTWSPWSAPVTVSAGTTGYTFTGLVPYDNYQFQVQGINADGSIMSSIVQRSRCANYVLPSANPVLQSNNTNLHIVVNGSTGIGGVDYGDLDCGIDACVADNTLGTDDIAYPVEYAATDPCGHNSNFYIQNIQLVNIANAALIYSFSFDGTGTTADINTHDMQPGIYAVTITSSDGVTTSTQVEID